jgi:arylsulfatase A-like enzyme
MVGKYLNGYGVARPREIPPGWSKWFALTAGTEQHRYGFKLNENGKVRHYPRKPANYIDYVLDSKVNGLLKKWAISPKPFFLYYNPNNPHGESGTPYWSTRDPEPAPQYNGVFGNITAPRPPNFDEPNVSDKPDAIRELPRLSPAELADIDRRYRGRQESLLSVDDEVKRIVKLVRKKGDKQRTFFIFTSDNGLMMGAHRIEFKDYPYQEAERVPLIIRGPGFPQNTTRDQLVANIDLAPTITALTGARPGLAMDGIPLLPLAKNPSDETNRSLLIETFDVGAFGVRQGPWAFNQWNDGDEELYDLQSDPYELTNLLHGPGASSYDDVRDQLATELAKLKSCSGTGCRN